MAKQKKNAVKKSGANGAKKAAPKVNDAALTARLGPIKKIVRWVDNPRKGASTKIAVLECGHGRALREGPRQTFRCNQCRIEKASGAKVISRFKKAGLAPVAAKKAVKKSAAKSAPKRATKPPVKAAKPAKKAAAPKKTAAPVARVAVPEAEADERLSA